MGGELLQQLSIWVLMFPRPLPHYSNFRNLAYQIILIIQVEINIEYSLFFSQPAVQTMVLWKSAKIMCDRGCLPIWVLILIVPQ